MRILTTALAGSCLCLFAGTVPFPADYRSWTVIKSKLVGPQSQFYAVDGGMHHFYANDKALEGYRTGKFPDGAVIVDERLEAIEQAGITIEGNRRSAAVMQKDSERYRETGGWGFDAFLGDDRTNGVPAQARMACFTCHSKAKDKDFVYSEYKAGGWNAHAAADYLDSRAKAWAEWKPAAAPGGTCFSCHSSMTYLLARPVLRATLGESASTPFETGLLDGLRARVGITEAKQAKEPIASQAMGVEAIFSALFLTLADSGKPVQSPAARQAFDRLWKLQIREGKAAGSWPWFSLDADPWEMPVSPFYGAALAAVAVGSAPPAYRGEVQDRIDALTAYLRREHEDQPLHNRLMLLWSAEKLPAVLPADARRSLLEEIRRAQQQDGSWSIQSLGPWKERATAPAAISSDSYATAFVAFILEKSGMPASDPVLKKALSWLLAHQNPAGYWDAISMNKTYAPGSMQSLFMRDAATAFAAAALANR